MRIKLLAIIVSLILLTGCSLAQPEQQNINQDNFIGFHAVVETWDMDSGVPDENGMTELPSSDRSHWTEYGADDIELDGFGSVSFPREVLFAEYDEETGHYIFRGMEGINAFCTIVDEGNSSSYSGYTQLSNSKISATNDAITSLEGTIYIENGNEDNFITLYRVFETEDGRIYLDGTGNSFGGAGGFSTSGKTEHKTYIGEEETVETFEITIHIEAIYPAAILEVMQYDKNNLPISSEVINAFDDTMTISLLPDTTFIMIVETDTQGEPHRSVVDRNTDPELQEYHSIRYLSESGTILSGLIDFISE